MFYSKKQEDDKQTQTEEKKQEEEEEDDELVQFQKQAREIFLNEWMKADSNWLDKLEPHHLEFLRDLLGV